MRLKGRLYLVNYAYDVLMRSYFAWEFEPGDNEILIPINVRIKINNRMQERQFEWILFYYLIFFPRFIFVFVVSFSICRGMI